MRAYDVGAMGNSADQMPEELLLLMREADSAIAAADYATAEQRLLQIELRLALIPNSSRADASVEFGNKVQDLLDRVRRLKASKKGPQVLKNKYLRPSVLEDC